MANTPAILSKNTNYQAGNGVTGYDSGNIVIQTKAGAPVVKQCDGTQQSATSLACSSAAGFADNYIEGTNQNNEMPATITNIALTSNVLTVTCANNFVVGQNVVLNGLTTNTSLNRLNFVVATATTAYFTATYTHANIVSGSDTGTATFTCKTRAAGLSMYGAE